MDNIRVAVWGFGAMGGGIAKVLLEKKGVEITGVCDIHPARVGKSIFELLGVERGERRDVTVCDDINKVAARGAAATGYGRCSPPLNRARGSSWRNTICRLLSGIQSAGLFGHSRAS